MLFLIVMFVLLGFWSWFCIRKDVIELIPVFVLFFMISLIILLNSNVGYSQPILLDEIEISGYDVKVMSNDCVYMYDSNGKISMIFDNADEITWNEDKSSNHDYFRIYIRTPLSNLWIDRDDPRFFYEIYLSPNSRKVIEAN